MKTTNFIVLVGALLILSACNFNLGKKGNGNVVTQERSISDNFTSLKSSAGIDVYLTQGNTNKITVEADENLQQYIKTEVENGKLVITTTENIGWAKAKKVYVTFKELNDISATSGSEISATSVVKSETLALESTSGAEIKLEVFTQNLTAKTSSGADMKVTGKASSFTGKASSGSELNAKDLQSITCLAEASSGGEIAVNVKDKLDARSSSGGQINFYGNPTTVNSEKSSGGSVNGK